MADQGTGPDEAALAVAARHALHDEEIVVALATGSLDDAGEADRARSLIERCALCRDLHADIAAIGSALGKASAFTAAAPRDFRLTAEDARRLGGTVVSPRGFLAALRRSIETIARPVGASLATFGLVGLLVGSVGLGGGAASAPRSVDTGSAAGPTVPAEFQAGGTQSEPPQASDRTTALGPGSSGDAKVEIETPRENTPTTAPSPFAWLLGGSVVLLIAGLLLLLVAFRRGRRGSTHS